MDGNATMINCKDPAAVEANGRERERTKLRISYEPRFASSTTFSFSFSFLLFPRLLREGVASAFLAPSTRDGGTYDTAPPSRFSYGRPGEGSLLACVGSGGGGGTRVGSSSCTASPVRDAGREVTGVVVYDETSTRLLPVPPPVRDITLCV